LGASHLKGSELRIAAIITTLDDDPTETIESLLTQDVRVLKIIVVVGSERLYHHLSQTVSGVDLLFVQPDFSKSLGIRLGKAINFALKKIRVDAYDFLLKLDADIVLPTEFLSRNLSVGADLVGQSGFSMLLRVRPFMKLLNGRWPEETAEDTYIAHLYSRHGYTVADLVLSPLMNREGGFCYSWRYQLERGLSMYKLGCEPLHVLAAAAVDFKLNRRSIFLVFGYALAALKRVETYEFASWNFNKQVSLFFNIRALVSRCHRTLS
jgi:hypothetical protein